MMNFVHPEALWALWLLLVPIGLWLYRRRLGKRPFTAPWFFSETSQPLRNLPWWHRWMRNRLFWLAILLVSLMVMTLARPRSSVEPLPTSNVVLVLDTTVSMLATSTDGKTSTFDEAKHKLATQLRSLPKPVSTTLVTMGAGARVVVSETLDRSLVLKKVEALRVEGTEAYRGQWSAQLRDFLEKYAPEDRTWVFSDQKMEELPTHATRWVKVGPTQGINLGITEAEVFRSHLQPRSSMITFTVVGVGSSPARDLEGKAQIHLDGRPAWVRNFKLVSGDSVTFTAQLDLRRAKHLKIHLQASEPDLLQEDNTVEVELSPLKPLTLGWVSDHRDPSLEMALHAMVDAGGLRLLRYPISHTSWHDPVDVWLLEGVSSDLEYQIKKPTWWHLPKALPPSIKVAPVEKTQAWNTTWNELQLQRWQFSPEPPARFQPESWTEIPRSSGSMFAASLDSGTRAFLSLMELHSHRTWLEDPAFPRWVHQTVSWLGEEALEREKVEIPSWSQLAKASPAAAVLAESESHLELGQAQDYEGKVEPSAAAFSADFTSWSAWLLGIILIAGLLETRWMWRDEREL